MAKVMNGLTQSDGGGTRINILAEFRYMIQGDPMIIMPAKQINKSSQNLRSRDGLPRTPMIRAVVAAWAYSPPVAETACVAASLDALTRLQIAPEAVVRMRVTRPRHQDPKSPRQIEILDLHNFAAFPFWLRDPDIANL